MNIEALIEEHSLVTDSQLEDVELDVAAIRNEVADLRANLRNALSLLTVLIEGDSRFQITRTLAGTSVMRVLPAQEERPAPVWEKPSLKIVGRN